MSSDETTRDEADPLLQRVVLAGAAVMVALLAGPLVAGRFYVYSDLLTFHLPLRVFYARCLASGDDFRWFPYYFCGFDLHGEGQIGLIHPVHLALYGMLPVAVALPAEFLTNYVLIFGGTFLFLRRWVGPSAAVVGGLCFSFFGYNVVHFMHINSVAVVAHLPWSLWLIDRLFRTPGRRPWDGLGLAALTGSELLLGHPQTVWYVKLIEGLYALFLSVTERRGRPLAAYAWYTGLGVLLGGVQLLPTWEAMTLSRRAVMSAREITLGSLHPLNLTQLVAPYAFLERYMPSHGGAGFNHYIRLYELGVYQGAVIVPLLVWLALRWPALRPDARRMARGALLLAALGVLLALGDYGPLGWVLVHAPLVNRFRVPARYLLLTHLALAVLAALAVDDLARCRRGTRPGETRSAWWLALVPLAGAACIAGVWIWDRRHPGSLPPLGTPARVGFNLLLLVAASALVATSVRRPRLGLSALVFVMVVDYAAYALYFLVWDSVPSLSATLAQRPEVPPVPEGYRLRLKPPTTGVAEPPLRSQYHSGLLSMAGHRLIEGYVALEPGRRLDYDTPESLRLAGVACAWDDDPAGGTWRPVADPLPRARLVARAVVVDDPAEALPGLDLARTAVVSAPVGIQDGPPGTVTIREDRPGHLAAEVATPTRQLLVWNEAYHPGWTATVDGLPRDVIRVNFDFQGCVVPSGRHAVEFRFRPRSFLAGAIVSAVGLALLAGSVLIEIGLRPRYPLADGRQAP